jgi:hypothetical protein
MEAPLGTERGFSSPDGRRPWTRALLASCLSLVLAALAAPPARAAKPLVVSQLEFPIPLVAPGDRVEVGYDTRGIPSPRGFLFVRNDLQHRFTRVSLELRRAEQRLVPSDALKLLRAVVPGRLLRGETLLYYAVVRDARTDRSVTIPAAGARAPERLWILSERSIVRLGTHRFGHTRPPDATVARAGPDGVGFENPPEGARFGPWSFEVGPDDSIWLLDEVNQRLLVWGAGDPDSVERSVALPPSPIDFALGPAGTLYVTRPADPADLRAYPGGLPPIRLDHLTATGEVAWESRLGTDVFNTQLRAGPTGALYWTGPSPSPRTERGSEYRWTPAATPAGQPVSLADQDRRTLWGYQPLPGGLRLVAATADFREDTIYGLAPHEMRYALIDRGGRVTRAWRIDSRTVIWPYQEATPDLVDGDPVVVVEATAGSGEHFQSEYVVLRLGRTGSARTRFSLRREAWGDVITDLRVGPDDNLYQLGSSPTNGIVISRFFLVPAGLS